MENPNFFSQDTGLSYPGYNNNIIFPNFEYPDYSLGLDDELFNERSTGPSFTFTPSILQTLLTDQDMTSTGSSASGSSNGGMQMNNNNEGHVVAFKIPTSLENLDDGYKWRKYGNKMVKSNPHPRHYYKCLSEGCKVRKQVQRDGDDPRFLMVTYNGKHNHEAKCLVYQEHPPNGGLSTPNLQPSTLIIRSSSI